ncbi:MAG: NfeD family protein [Chthoniobacterales bacterium]|jgi:membrane-bound serine protease (ClpP class)
MPEGPVLIGTLVIAGFLLVAAEVLLPGLIAGTLGFLCLAASVALVFHQYGAGPGFVAALVIGGVSVVGLVVWLNIFPKTFIGRRVVLSRRQTHDTPAGTELVGSVGVALTPLRPAGTARLGGKRVDVTAVGEFLEEGSPVVVVAADGLRVAVRRKDKLETPAPSA